MIGDEWPAILGVLGALLALVPVVRWLTERFGASPEVARKAIHVVMGLTCSAFPWIFHQPAAVWMLALLATLPIILLRIVPALRTGVGAVLHGIKRPSYGEVLFAPSVAAVFQLSKGDALLHLIPILILTVADAAGALAGTRWGRRHYGSGEGLKTVEGSAIFLIIAFVCVLVPLLIDGRVGSGQALWIALILATLGMMGEGFSDRGFDNLVVPLGSFFVLERLMVLETPSLVGRFVVLVFVLVLVLAGSKWSTLSGAALLGSALLGYGCAVIADWRFALPPCAVFICHLYTTRKHHLAGVFDHRMDAVVSHAIAAMPWVIATHMGFVPPLVGLAGISFSMACQLAILDAATRSWLKGVASRPIRSALKGWLFAALPGLVWIWQSYHALAVPVILGFFATFGTVLLFDFIRSRYQGHATGLWIIKGLIALVSSFPALVLRL
jgi:phytol kinase